MCIPLIEHYNKEISGGIFNASNQIISTSCVAEESMVNCFSDILFDVNFNVEKGASFKANIIVCY